MDWNLTLEVEGEGPDEAFAAPKSSQGAAAETDQERESSSDGEDQEEDGGGSMLTFLLSAVGWGIFTLLMPCTYPMIPITISFFT